MQPPVPSNYRHVLREELANRCRKNPQYSLRSFARILRLEPTHLSAVLNGKKGISRDVAAGIARTLGMSSNEAIYFCDLVESEHARSRAVRELAAERVRLNAQAQDSRMELSIDAFRAVSDWFHFALLQLMKIPQYRDEPKWIAGRLGISEIQAKEALARLARLELVETVDGRTQPTDATVASADGIPSEAIRKFHEQSLEKAIQALHLQSVEERDITAEVMAIAREDLPKAKRMIRDFRREMVRELAGTPAPDEVYCLSLQLFSFSQHPSSVPKESL